MSSEFVCPQCGKSEFYETFTRRQLIIQRVDLKARRGSEEVDYTSDYDQVEPIETWTCSGCHYVLEEAEASKVLESVLGGLFWAEPAGSRR